MLSYVMVLIVLMLVVVTILLGFTYQFLVKRIHVDYRMLQVYLTTTLVQLLQEMGIIQTLLIVTIGMGQQQLLIKDHVNNKLKKHKKTLIKSEGFFVIYYQYK